MPKISELDQTTLPINNDAFVIARSGDNKQIIYSDLVNPSSIPINTDNFTVFTSSTLQSVLNENDQTLNNLQNELNTAGYVDQSNSWSGTQVAVPVSLATSTGISPNFNLSNVFNIYLSGSTTVQAAIGVQNGASYLLRVWNSGSIIWDSGSYDFGDNGAPTLSTTNGIYDIVGFLGSSGNILAFCGLQTGFTK